MALGSAQIACGVIPAHYVEPLVSFGSRYLRRVFMAERIVRQLIDDLDGSEIPNDGGERIEFSLRGVDYRIDLSSANAAKLDKAMKPFIDGAAKIGRRRRTKAGSGGSASKEQLAAIRDWARKNGYEVAERGRIKADIMEAFEAAH
jgi:hypothetical protein